jgi:hypothetical protein
MARRLSRALMVVTSLAMLAAGVVVFLAGSHAPRPELAHAAGTYTIDILARSFNPSHCQLNRNGDIVRWRNADSVVRRVSLPPITGAERVVLEVAPGGYSEPFEFHHGNVNWEYWDADDPTISGHLNVPQDPGAPASCSPLPPTPTPTPTRTPTPIPAPTLPIQKPLACAGLMPPNDAGERNPVKGCAVAPDMARQEQFE